MQEQFKLAGPDTLPQERADGDALLRLAALADSFGAERLAADSRALAERIAEGRFYVACVGLF